MKKLHFAALLSAFTILAPIPAVAQMMPDMPKSMPKTMAPPPAPMPSEPTPPAPSAPEAPPAPSADAAPQAITVAEAVAADFSKYDKDSSGTLNKAEFSAWIGEAKAKVDGKTPDPKALGEAFIKADVDKSKTVTAAELTSFLS